MLSSIFWFSDGPCSWKLINYLLTMDWKKDGAVHTTPTDAGCSEGQCVQSCTL